MKVIALAASQRAGSYNARLIESVRNITDDSVEFSQLDYAAILPPLYDEGDVVGEGTLPEPAQYFVDELLSADALIIACPEYNWSIPGHFKNLIDWASCLRPYPFTNKPVLLMSATPSRRGGLLGLTHLQMVLSALGARVFPQFFSLVQAHETLLDGGGFAFPPLQEELEATIRAFYQGVSSK